MYRHPLRMYLNCISSVAIPLYSVHPVVLCRCVSCRACHVSLPVLLVPSFATVFNLYRYMRLYRLSSILDDTVEYMCHNVSQCIYQMYRESLGNLEPCISAVSQLALMTARCLGRLDLPTRAPLQQCLTARVRLRAAAGCEAPPP